MSLHGTYDDQNIFAKIIRGEAPAAKLLETDDVIAFMDVFPQAKGHCLVVPKHPARNLLELPAEAAQAAMVEVKRLAEATDKALSPDGITIAQFNGAPAGQTVFHIHFHVIPQWEGEKLASHGGGKMADTAELEALAERIRAAL
jgi:histidine triad (HIT) family protein